jgi:hypothetical protein
VTGAFKQTFKHAAKELGLKKSALLEKLLAEWRERHPAVTAGAGAKAASGTTPSRRARDAKAPGKAATSPRRA